MKRTVSILLIAAALLACCLAPACGSKYKRHALSYFSAGFSWDLTVEQAKKYLDSNSTAGTAEISREGGETLVANASTEFRFGADGKMIMAASVIGGLSDAPKMIDSWFGRHDKKVKDPETGMDCYIWYGTMNGRNAEAELFERDGLWILRFEPAD